MAIQVGNKVAAGSFGIMKSEGPVSMTTEDLFKGKRAVLFSVLGAFTPTYSKTHLPRFVQNASALKTKGIDTATRVLFLWALTLMSLGASALLAQAPQYAHSRNT